MLGARGVDVLAWEDFGKRWVADIVGELKPPDVRVLEADYGRLPDLGAVDFDRDVVFTWNGTASGVRVPDGDWIAADRRGLTFADATSALFAQAIDWAKIDVATFSWQKVLGGEAAHGMIVLSPRAFERLESHRPSWPVPKLFRLAEDGRVLDDLFAGVTINTPSMLCVEDYLDALALGREHRRPRRRCRRAPTPTPRCCSTGSRARRGSPTSPPIRRRAPTPPCACASPTCRRCGGGSAASPTAWSPCSPPRGLPTTSAPTATAPPGLRIWCGVTIERADLEALTPWLDWAYGEARAAAVNAHRGSPPSA